MEWHWVDAMAAHLDVQPWVRPAIREAVAEVSAVQQRMPLTTGLLHADPGPTSFLIEASGRVAVIDWGLRLEQTRRSPFSASSLQVGFSHLQG